jgi:RNA polymerase-binding transcription factor DksA
MAAHQTLHHPLTRRELDDFKTVLLEKRRLLVGDLTALEADLFEESPSSPSPGTHLADLGTDVTETDVNFGSRMEVSLEIQEIDDALRRLQEGTFGRCEGCGEQIVRARLEAIPYARLCLQCRKEEEARASSP